MPDDRTENNDGHPSPQDAATLIPAPTPAPDATLPASRPPTAVTDPYSTLALPGTTPADSEGTLALPSSKAATVRPTSQAVPGYEILIELGRGGMGVVYKARQTSLKRIVALKMILGGGHASPEALARFLAEAQSVARLQHPNVVQVYEVGDHNGLPYFSLEFVEGGALDRRLAGTPLPPQQAARLVRDIARGVHAAHQAGVIHRDLKPANVLLALDGTPKVTDFGLAKQVGSDSGQTRSGAIMGTPSYMAPEQAQGKGKEAGPAADVYALGAILYECLTGRPPFRAATPMETVLQVIRDEPVTPRAFCTKVPRDLETICLKCLHKDPHRRYESAAAFADELGRYLEGEPIQARPVGRMERGIRWVRKNPARASLLVVSLFAIVAILLLQEMDKRREHARSKELSEANATVKSALEDARARRKEADLAADEARHAHKEAEAARMDAVDQLYSANIDLAWREWEHNNVYRTAQLLEDCPSKLRGWEWTWLKSLCMLDRQTMHGHSEGIQSLVVNTDGRHFASCDAHGTRYWDLASGRELEALNTPGPITFSPDGTKAAIADGKSINVVEEKDGRAVFSISTGKGSVVALAFAEQGKEVRAVTFEDGSVHRWDAATGKHLGSVPLEMGLFAINREGAHRPQFSPDGRWVGAGGQRGTIRVWDAATGKRIHEFDNTPLMHASHVAFSAAGDRVAAAWAEGTVAVWELPSGKELEQWRAHFGPVHAVAFSPDGRWLATGSQDQSAKIWGLADYEEWLTLRGHAGEVTALAFTPDSTSLLTGSGDRTVKSWDIRDRRFYGGPRKEHVRAQLKSTGTVRLPPSSMAHRTFYGHVGPTIAFAFSPDGNQIATASNGDGAIVLWDLKSNHELGTLAIPSAPMCEVAFLPDGKKLLAAIGPDEKRPGSVRVWAIPDGKLLLDHSLSTGKPTGLVVLPKLNAAVIALACERSTRLSWIDLASGAEQGALDLDGIWAHSIGLTDDGRLVVGSPSQVTLIDPHKRQIIGSFGVKDSRCLAVGRGQLVAVGHDDLLIRLYDLATGKIVREMEGNTSPVQSVSFSPNGRRLASAAGETVKVWTVDTGRNLLTFSDHYREVDRVRWGPKGQNLASSSWDDSLKIWEAPPDVASPTDRWPILFADRFDDPKLRSMWAKSPNWTIENEALRGELVEAVQPDGWGTFGLAQFTLPGVSMPDTVEVRVTCWTSAPMMCEVGLTRARTDFAIGALLMGVPEAFGVTGASVQVTRNGKQLGLVGVPRTRFRFNPGHHYQVHVLRERARLTLTIDGEMILSEAVPTAPGPMLRLTGAWGELGTAIYFDDLEIRAPEDAIREQQLRDRVEASFSKCLIRAPVREEIATDASLSDTDRQFMNVYLTTLREEPAKLIEVVFETTLNPNRKPADYALALRQVEQVSSLAPSEWRAKLPMSLALYRTGKFENAITSASEYRAALRANSGTSPPAAIAIEAMAQHQLGHSVEAGAALTRARDLMRSASWARDERARLLVSEAQALIGLPNDSNFRETEAVKSALFGTLEAGWGRGDLEAYLAGHTADCTVIDARAREPSAFDVVLDRDKFAAVRKYELPPASARNVQTSYEDVQVLFGDNSANCSFVNTRSSPGRMITHHVEFQLRPTAQAWSICRVRSWVANERNGEQLLNFNAAYWKARDAAVEEARKTADPRKLAAALVAARRFAEALPIAHEAVKATDATAADWETCGEAAFMLAQVDEAARAFRTAIKLDPTLEFPWYLSRLRATLRGHDGAVFAVAWQPNGNLLASGGADRPLRIWDPQQRKLAWMLEGHLGGISGLTFAPDGKSILSGGYDLDLRLWDVDSQKLRRAMRGNKFLVNRLAFDPRGTHFVTASDDNAAHIWDLATGKELLLVRHGAAVTSAVFSPDGREIATASRDSTIRIWNAATGKERLVLRGHKGDVLRAAYSPDGSRLASAGQDGTVRIWDVVSGKELLKRSGHTGAVESIAFSPDGKWLASGGADTTICLWEATDAKLREVLRGHRGTVHALAFNADNSRLASAGGDGTVRIWDVGNR